jgi:predicted RNase H-like nuclease (RuvC/YqgF family)
MSQSSSEYLKQENNELKYKLEKMQEKMIFLKNHLIEMKDKTYESELLQNKIEQLNQINKS